MVVIDQTQIKEANFLSQILGDQWLELPEVLKKRYPLVSSKKSVVCSMAVEIHEICYSWLAKLLMPFISVFWVAIPDNLQSLHLDIEESSATPLKHMRLRRYARLKNFNKPKNKLNFHSLLQYENANQFIEYSRFGFGLALHVTLENAVLTYRDMGFVFNFFGKPINILPLGLLIGRVTIQEKALDHETFSRKLVVAHPWFGVFLKFKATFKLCTK